MVNKFQSWFPELKQFQFTLQFTITIGVLLTQLVDQESQTRGHLVRWSYICCLYSDKKKTIGVDRGGGGGGGD